MSLILKKAELLLLGTEMGLALSQDFELGAIERMVSFAAKNLPQPQSEFGRKVAAKYSIEFEGKMTSCFGYWEKGHPCCTVCRQQTECSQVAVKASVGGLAAPAIAYFKANDGRDDRESAPPKEIDLNVRRSVAVTSSELDRVALISWIDLTFPQFRRRDFRENVSYYASEPSSRKNVVLRVEQFSSKNYFVCFPLITPELAETLGMQNTKYGWYSSVRNTEQLKESITTYVSQLSVSTVDSFSSEESFKREVIEFVTKFGGGKFRVELRSGYEIVLDSNNFRVMYLDKFTTRMLNTCFTRMTPEESSKLGLNWDKSYGGVYKRTNREELLTLIGDYLEKVVMKMNVEQ